MNNEVSKAIKTFAKISPVIQNLPKLWVVFDAVGTVIEPTPSVAEAYWSIGRKFGTSLSIENVRQRFQHAFAESLSVDQNEHHSNESIELARWQRIVNMVLDDVNDQDNCFREVHAHFSAPSAWRVFDDVEPVFQKLKQLGFGVAIGSNFDERLHDVCKGHSELDLVDAAFASADIGFRKPSVKFYQELSLRLKSAPERMIMVGDHLENDVLAARRAGLQAVHLDRQEKGTQDESSIRSVNDLPAILEKQFLNRDNSHSW